jgi:hypothetical protein
VGRPKKRANLRRCPRQWILWQFAENASVTVVTSVGDESGQSLSVPSGINGELDGWRKTRTSGAKARKFSRAYGTSELVPFPLVSMVEFCARALTYKSYRRAEALRHSKSRAMCAYLERGCMGRIP